MRVAIGQFELESNTFVLQQADVRHFAREQLLTGDEVIRTLRGTRAEVGGFLDVLAEAALEIFPTVAAHGVSSGIVPRATFDQIGGDILAGIEAARPDAVLLSLHGAMVVEGEHDGEGLLLEAVRRRVGPDVPIVASLDLHGNITSRMVEQADALVGYDTYPHVDQYQTGVRAARLLTRALRGEVRLRTVHAKVPMIVPAEGQGTRDEPMRALMASANAWEREPGVLSTSLFAVQPWLDVPDIGLSAVAVVDGPERAADAERRARELVRAAWDVRHQFDAQLLEVDEAIRRALALEGGPVILSESAAAPAPARRATA